jgi:hypothetical protein
MTGILERIEEKLDRLLAGGGANVAAVAAQPLAQQPQANVAMQQPQALAQPQAQAGGLGVLGGAQQPVGYPPATADMLTTLITPHIGDPNIKAALQQQMAAMGINALPETQPHQYGELYARFQQVIQQFTAAAAAQQQPAATPASII